MHLEPRVGRGERARLCLAAAGIVRIVAQVGHDHGVVGKRAVGQVHRKLRERHQVLQLLLVIHHVGEKRDDVVPPRIAPRITACITHGWQVFRVRLPRFPCREQPSDEVVLGDDTRVVVIVRDDLPHRQHEVVADGRMRVRVVFRRKPIVPCEALQVRHRRAVDHPRIVRVLLDHDEDVPDPRHPTGCRRGRSALCARRDGERGHERQSACAHSGLRNSDRAGSRASSSSVTSYPAR